MKLSTIRPLPSRWAVPLHTVAKDNRIVDRVGFIERSTCMLLPIAFLYNISPASRRHFVLTGFPKSSRNKENIDKPATTIPLGLFESSYMTFGLDRLGYLDTRYLPPIYGRIHVSSKDEERHLEDTPSFNASTTIRS